MAIKNIVNDKAMSPKQRSDYIMSLTRKMLSAMGIEAEKIDQIIDEHSKTVNAVKEERDKLADDVNKYKADADKLKTVEEELEKVKGELDAIDLDALDKKYKDLKTEYDEYKKGVEEQTTHQQKLEAYKQLLIESGVAEKRTASILKVSDVDSIELDAEGKIKDADKLTESIKTEWADFIQTNGQQGASVSNPPDNTGGDTFEGLSLQDKMKFANEHPEDTGVKAWLGK